MLEPNSCQSFMLTKTVESPYANYFAGCSPVAVAGGRGARTSTKHRSIYKGPPRMRPKESGDGEAHLLLFGLGERHLGQSSFACRRQRCSFAYNTPNI